jgi:two-component system, cell cycle sensor histidine kinase and response regulator CckA
MSKSTGLQPSQPSPSFQPQTSAGPCPPRLRDSRAPPQTTPGPCYWRLHDGWFLMTDRGKVLFGLEPGVELTYSCFLQLLHLDDRGEVHQALQRALGEGDGCDVEFRVPGPDGTARWLAAKGEALREGGGDAVELHGVVSDVTDRRRGDERVRQTDRLEAVSRLAGGVAHEINNMLTVIMGYAEHLRHTLGPDHDQSPDLSQILGAAGRASQVTQQLLAFGRRQLLTPTRLDLAPFIDGLRPALEDILGPGCLLVIVIREPGGAVAADRGQLEQMLTHLCRNARDAMPHGGRVIIEVGQTLLREGNDRNPEKRRAAGPYVRMAVRDTGCGMTPNVLARAFEPFFTTKSVGEGTGLGLTTVYGIVQQAEGCVWIDSTPGRGTNVEVYLPASEGAAK